MSQHIEIRKHFWMPEDLEMWASAVSLISEHGENPDYDRGVAELLTEYAGFDLSMAPAVLSALRSDKATP